METFSPCWSKVFELAAFEEPLAAGTAHSFTQVSHHPHMPSLVTLSPALLPLICVCSCSLLVLLEFGACDATWAPAAASSSHGLKRSVSIKIQTRGSETKLKKRLKIKGVMISCNTQTTWKIKHLGGKQRMSGMKRNWWRAEEESNHSGKQRKGAWWMFPHDFWVAKETVFICVRSLN